MGDHVILFVFMESLDADRFLLGEPWSNDKQLVSLRRMEKNISTRGLTFDKTTFWVQIHNLHMGDMNPKVACEIGKVIKKVQKGMKDWGSHNESSYMRIRVLVDTSKPLCQGRKIHCEDGEIVCIRFKYERLPNLCYWCRRLSHSDKDCDLWVQSNGSLTEENRQFEAWLRAPPPNTKKCSMVRVEGWEEAKVGCIGQEEK